MTLKEIVHSDPEILGGTPVFVGTRVPVRILLDVSTSMETGAEPKFHFARQIAGAMCYVGLVRLDSICLQPFSNQLHDAFHAGGGRHRFQPPRY